jgi:hypothetical protein
MNLSPDKPMPTLMTLLDERRPLISNHRRPHWAWPWITFLLGLALGWILHLHLS